MKLKSIIKSLFLIFFFSICQNTPGFSQTKQETEAWLKDKIELFAYSNDNSVFNTYQVYFKDGNFILEVKSRLVVTQYDEITTTIAIVPIKELSSIRFEDKPKNVWLYLKIKNEKNIIEHFNYDTGVKRFINEFPILLENDVKENDYKKRMTKAFDNLIRLNGGIIVKETY